MNEQLLHDVVRANDIMAAARADGRRLSDAEKSFVKAVDRGVKAFKEREANEAMATNSRRCLRSSRRRCGMYGQYSVMTRRTRCLLMPKTAATW